MRLVYFLTLVLLSSSSLATPDSTIVPNRLNSGPQSPWFDQGETLISSRKNIPQSLSASLGMMMGSLVDQGENRSTHYVGIDQTLQNLDFTSKNYGVELTQIGLVGVHFELRTLMALSKNYEPYYEWGLGALYKPQEGFASFINYERYQARIGAGFEDFLHRNRKFRLGVQAGLSTLGMSFNLHLAYSIPN